MWHNFKGRFKIAAKAYRLTPYLFEDDPKEFLGKDFDEVYADDAVCLLSKYLDDNVLSRINIDLPANQIWAKLASGANEGPAGQMVGRYQASLNAYKCKPGASIREHVDTVQGMINQVEGYGRTQTDWEKRDRLVNSLPPSWNGFKTAYLASNVFDLDQIVRDLYTEEQRLAEQEKESAMAMVATRPAYQVSYPAKDFSTYRCYNCDKIGHIKRKCPFPAKGSKPYQEGSKPSDPYRASVRAATIPDSCDDVTSGDNMIDQARVMTMTASTTSMNPARMTCNAIQTDPTEPATALLSGTVKNRDWVTDTGSDHHVSHNKDVFLEIRKTKMPSKVSFGDKSSQPVIGSGDAIVSDTLVAKDCLYVPKIDFNLLSVSKATKDGGVATFREDRWDLRRDGIVVASGPQKDGLYWLKPEEQANVLMTRADETAELWHRRLAHIGQKAMARLELMVEGVDLKDGHCDTLKCEGCLKGKHTRRPFPPQSYSRATEPLELVHTDLCSMPTRCVFGNKYFVTFTDDKTRFTWIYFLREKSGALDAFNKFIAEAERQSGCKLKTVRSDNGGEYINADFDKFFAEHGITRNLSNVHTPQQNGVAERLNRTLIEAAKAMLFMAGMQPEFWSFAVNAANHILNRTPIKALSDMTSFEAWFGKRPDLSYTRVFGSPAWIHVPDATRKKLDPNAKEARFVGYPNGTKGWLFWDPEKKKMVRSRDVTFHELSNNDMQDEQSAAVTEPANERSSADLSDAPIIVTPEMHEEVDDYDDINLLFTVLFNTVLPETTPRKPKLICAAHEILQPRNFKEMTTLPEREYWEEAQLDQMTTLWEMKTWELVPRPTDKPVIGCKWDFRVKTLADGSIDKLKARLVAKGYNQVYGRDFLETFAPVPKFSTVRTLIVLAAQERLELHHLDVVAAFLNGTLREEVYMEQPEGFADGTDRVCKLQKTLYGLKQSGREWYLELCSFLIDYGFVQCEQEQGLFVLHGGAIRLIVYVDDLLLVARDKDALANFKAAIKAKWAMSDLGLATQFCGIELQRHDDGSVSLSAARYVDEILRRFNMGDCRGTALPMDTNAKFSAFPADQRPTPEEQSEMATIPYQEAIGCLMYVMTTTRPDLAFPLSILCKYMSNPSIEHWRAMKRLLRYLQFTKGHALRLQPGDLTLDLYSDANYAGCADTGKSTSGYISLLGGSCISWCSRKQEIVALSTTEAEYVGLSNAAKEMQWLKYIITHMSPSIKGEDAKLVVRLHGDNQGAIALARDNKFHARTKHIMTKFHYVRECLRMGYMSLGYVATTDMVADILTKALSRVKLERFKELLRIG